MNNKCHSFSSEFQNILVEIRSTCNIPQSVSPHVSNSSVFDAWFFVIVHSALGTGTIVQLVKCGCAAIELTAENLNISGLLSM